MHSGTAVTTKAFEIVDPLRLFSPIAELPGSIWLDSSLHFGDRGRFSFVARTPSLDVSVHNGKVAVSGQDETAFVDSQADVLEPLEALWRSDTRFVVGYITYEATLSFLGIDRIKQTLPVPEMRFLFYDSVVCFDHLMGVITVTNPDHDDYSDLFAGASADYVGNTTESSVVIPTVSRVEYLKNVERIKRYIFEGDVYQVNFTGRFDVHSQSSPLVVYQRLRRLNPSPYGAFLNFGDYQILSSSPERMFKKDGRHISTSPIKGTIARGKNRLEEAVNLQRLLSSEKDKAELLMIVDLERNDLGKVAQVGTVQVDEIFRSEVYSSLIHLASDISAELRPEVGLTDVFKALLPGGSITGAPKRRAVEIINQLEATPRSVYTGCIGYIDGDRAVYNIAIRTILCQGERYYVHAGGGIVADSDPETEYQEMLLKASNLFQALRVNP
jgi:para-aminobenzoate synthetase component 1